MGILEPDFCSDQPWTLIRHKTINVINILACSVERPLANLYSKASLDGCLLVGSKDWTLIGGICISPRDVPHIFPGTCVPTFCKVREN